MVLLFVSIMDIDSLISAVLVRPSLWDRRLKSHSNRSMVQNLWEEVSKEMGVNEIVARKKWKYLRDQFSVEFGKIPKSRSGEPAPNYTVKWPYFDSLLFLRDVVKPRTSGRNRTKTAVTTEVEEEMNNVRDEISIQGPDLDSDTLPNDDSITSGTSSVKTEYLEIDYNHSLTTQRKRKYDINSWNEEDENIGQPELQYLQEKSNKRSRESDEDDHSSFFKSLLPYVRKIPPNRILSFRGRVQQIVDEYAFGLSSIYITAAQVSPHSSST
ncbi:hypothetical protein HHI36_018966 [Cryptolaemus montrouzieri]|uniref:MADF domain-containing protein n=1 Tax=Cryptolaemus montrouzieri TaxID=559131 RepID=A0ABD2P1J5_9CUCU